MHAMERAMRVCSPIIIPRYNDLLTMCSRIRSEKDFLAGSRFPATGLVARYGLATGYAAGVTAAPRA